MKRFTDWFNNLYPVWLVSLAVIAFFKPSVMLWFDSNWVFWSLAASMLAMGLTLSLEDFKAVGRMPGSVALGFIAQYTIMPLAGWATAKGLGLEPGLAVGIILIERTGSGFGVWGEAVNTSPVFRHPRSYAPAPAIRERALSRHELTREL